MAGVNHSLPIMNKLIVYCGDFTWCPINIEIIGDLRLTDEQMSEQGKNLRPYQRGNEQRRVFTNSPNVLQGIQVSVKRKLLTPEQVEIMFMTGPHALNLKINDDGFIIDPPGHFFEQSTRDLMELF